LIAALAGERRPQSGRVTLDGDAITALPAALLARRRAVLPQSTALAFDFTVAEVVALGCLPFVGSEQALVDEAALAAACEATGIGALRGRRYGTLSGGEQQRVQLARVLAQLWRAGPEPAARYLLLDEPTAALELWPRGALAGRVRDLAGDGIGVLAAVHDRHRAGDCDDEVVLRRGGRVVAAGPPANVLEPAMLQACFGVPVELVRRADGRLG